MARNNGKWVVIENTPGYMPDDEPAEFDTKRAAMGHMVELKHELIELGYHVRGTASEGYYAERDSNDLGRVVEISWQPAD